VFVNNNVIPAFCNKDMIGVVPESDDAKALIDELELPNGAGIQID